MPGCFSIYDLKVETTYKRCMKARKLGEKKERKGNDGKNGEKIKSQKVASIGNEVKKMIKEQKEIVKKFFSNRHELRQQGFLCILFCFNRAV